MSDEELKKKHWDMWHELFGILRADNPTRAISEVIGDILIIHEYHAQAHTIEVLKKLLKKPVTGIRDYTEAVPRKVIEAEIKRLESNDE